MFNRRSFIAVVASLLAAPVAVVWALVAKKPKLDIDAVANEFIRNLGRELPREIAANLRAHHAQHMEMSGNLAAMAGYPPQTTGNPSC